jgi:uncharacterized damage-inducible protein DinB
MMSRDSFLDYWPSVRTRTRRLADIIPEDRLEWQPAPGRWSFGDTLRHLAGIERWMYGETVHGRPARYPGHGPGLADGLGAVTAYLDRCHTDSMELFRALTPEQWTGKSLTVAGTPITTWKWLRAMVEHEAHHRGQMYFMLGMLGVQTPPLYGLSEEEVLARSIHVVDAP